MPRPPIWLANLIQRGTPFTEVPNQNVAHGLPADQPSLWATPTDVTTERSLADELFRPNTREQGLMSWLGAVSNVVDPETLAKGAALWPLGWIRRQPQSALGRRTIDDFSREAWSGARAMENRNLAQGNQLEYAAKVSDEANPSAPLIPVRANFYRHANDAGDQAWELSWLGPGRGISPWTRQVKGSDLGPTSGNLGPRGLSELFNRFKADAAQAGAPPDFVNFGRVGGAAAKKHRLYGGSDPAFAVDLRGPRPRFIKESDANLPTDSPRWQRYSDWHEFNYGDKPTPNPNPTPARPPVGRPPMSGPSAAEHQRAMETLFGPTDQQERDMLRRALDQASRPSRRLTDLFRRGR